MSIEQMFFQAHGQSIQGLAVLTGTANQKGRSRDPPSVITQCRFTECWLLRASAQYPYANDAKGLGQYSLKAVRSTPLSHERQTGINMCL
jgi:hypothetical protein